MVAAVRLVLEVGGWVLGGRFDAVLDEVFGFRGFGYLLGGIVGCIFSLGIDLMGSGLHVSRSVMVVYVCIS